MKNSSTPSFGSRPLLLTALAFASLAALPAIAQTTGMAFKPTVLHRFTGTADTAQLGGMPMVPPVLAKDGSGQLQGHTFNGGTPLTFVLGQGVSYRLDALKGTGYQARLLGDISKSTTTLVQDAAGNFYGGAGSSNVANDTSANPFGSTAAMFSLKANVATALPTPPVRPRGQLAIDDDKRVYFGGGDGPSTCNANGSLAAGLWRMNPDGSYAKAFDFCQFFTVVGRLQLHEKGGAPVASVWSRTDQALYVLTSVGAAGVFDSTQASDNAGRAFGTLVKIDQAALDEGAAHNGQLDSADKVKVLHTFLRNRDGAPTSVGDRYSALVEAGEWLYGTSYANAPTAGGVNDLRYGGTLWRVKKDDPASFTVLHRFRGADTLAKDETAQADGATPNGPLVLAADGNIYGTTARDGSSLSRSATGLPTPSGAGTLFRVVVGSKADRADDSYEVLHRFDVAVEGARPVGLSLGTSVDGVQKLYGATASGGPGETINPASPDTTGNGTVFSIDVPLPSVSFTTPLTASASSALIGDRPTLSWATQNAASCTASGSNGDTWRGAQQTQGSQIPLSGALNKTGVNTFTLRCESNAGGPAAVQTVSITVKAVTVAPPATSDGSGTGTWERNDNRSDGGGPLSPWLLLPLAALGLARRFARRG
ncbi:choice-of-anchor tandem repeat GloVer-containing protein [Variovorax sp. LT1R16]|uniref:choice-of-anchor tandem repeat GloVer-containing protein n=1 Tax=Variovorax sp. LT1R16 TaxID=3443728 RepID=UPI003F46E131